MSDSLKREQETETTIADQSLFPGMEVEVGRNPADIPVKDLTDAELTEEYNRCTVSLKDWYERMNLRQQEILTEDSAYSDRIPKDEQLRFITGESLKSDARVRHIRFEKEYREAARDLEDQVWEGVGKHLHDLDLNPKADFKSYLDLIRSGYSYTGKVRREDRKLRYEDDDECLAYSPRFNYLFDASVEKVVEAMEARSGEWNKEKLLEGMTELAVEGYNPVSDNNYFSRLLIGSMVRVGGVEGLSEVDACLGSIISKRDGSFPYDTKLMRAKYDLNIDADSDYITEQDYWEDEAPDSDQVDDHGLGDYYLGDRFYTDDDSLHSIHHHICELVKEMPWGTEQVEDLSEQLVNLFKHDSSGTFGSYVEVFQQLGPASYQALLHGINSSDKLTRITCENILFDIELGEVDVEKGMVEIYGKMFQLVDEAARSRIVDDIVKARRISPRGDWGAFDKEGAAKGLFKLEPEDFKDPEDSEPREVKLDIDLYSMIRSVCIPRADEIPQMRMEREKVLTSYLNNFSKVIDGFYNDTGVWLNSLELHEQALFIYHLTSETDAQEVKNIKEIASRYGVKALSVYTALEYGSVGQEITDFLISPAVDEGFKNRVLDNYFLLTRRAYDWRSVFSASEEGKPFKFSDELYEAFVRKSSEYLRAAIVIDQNNGGEVAREELLDSMNQISFALHSLRGLYDKIPSLVLEKPQGTKGSNPRVQKESSKENNTTYVDGSTTWIFVNNMDQTRLVVTTRPYKTDEGEARINFKVVNTHKKVEARIAVDISNFDKYTGLDSGEPVVSLDLGTGKSKEGDRGTTRVGRVLTTAGGEGGHNNASFSNKSLEFFPKIAQSLATYLHGRYNDIAPTEDN